MTRAGAAPRELTEEQELALAKDERLLAIFWASRQWPPFRGHPAGLRDRARRATLAFARLEKLKLIQWGPGERARLLVARDFAWRSRGLAKKACAPRYGRISARALRRRAGAPAFRIVRAFSRIGGRDERQAEAARRRVQGARRSRLVLLASRRIGVALLAGCRPWEFSAVNALKRRSRSA